jgi:hemoglobin
MKDVHRGRSIAHHHFDLVAKYLTDSFLAAGAPEEITQTVIGAVAPLSGDIVSAG